MVVDIEPAELGFRRPFTVEVAQVLKIKNIGVSPIAFKVKTTAPKQYCVRPNSGRVEPDREVEVTVLLQAMKQDPPLDLKCRDKFLVQSVSISGDKEFASVQDIWDSVEKSAIQERKIRVNFLPAEGGDSPGASAVTPMRKSFANGVEATPDAPPPAYSSPGEDDTIASTAQAPEQPSSPELKENPSPESTSEGVPRGGAVASVKEVTVETLKAQLAKAEATIASLRNSDGGLRQRKGAGAGKDDAPPAVAQLQQAVRQGTEGVPVQIVALLCLISFLLAYFFF